MRTDKSIYSLFDVAGSDENALTKSFGVILRKDKTLLKKLLSLAVDKNRFSVSKQLFESSSFKFEKSDSEGRTDIEISNNEFHIIIESKTGRNEVKPKQAEKYADRLNHSESKLKVFIFMTEIGNLDIPNKLIKKYPEIVFSNLSWEQTLKLLHERKQIKVDLVKEYENYLLSTQKMKIYDIDIWAVVVKGKQEKNFDKGNYYINSRKHKPIFIGKRIWDKKLGKVVVKELRPVLKIHDKDSKEGKENSNSYVYDLGKILTLKNPIIKGKKFAQGSAIRVSFGEM